MRLLQEWRATDGKCVDIFAWITRNYKWYVIVDFSHWLRRTSRIWLCTNLWYVSWWNILMPGNIFIFHLLQPPGTSIHPLPASNQYKLFTVCRCYSCSRGVWRRLRRRIRRPGTLFVLGGQKNRSPPHLGIRTWGKAYFIQIAVQSL